MLATKIGWAPRALLWFFMGRIARQSKIVFRNVYTRSKWGLDLIDMILTMETSGMQKKGANTFFCAYALIIFGWIY